MSETTSAFRITSKELHGTTTVTVLRVTISLLESMGDVDWRSFMSAIAALFERAKSEQQRYAILCYVSTGAALSVPQIMELVKLLSQNREVTRLYSITTAVVIADGTAEALIKLVLRMYTPVGHVEISPSVDEAKAHIRQRALAAYAAREGV
jgi:hypothetical protein